MMELSLYGAYDPPDITEVEFDKRREYVHEFSLTHKKRWMSHDRIVSELSKLPIVENVQLADTGGRWNYEATITGEVKMPVKQEQASRKLARAALAAEFDKIEGANLSDVEVSRTDTRRRRTIKGNLSVEFPDQSTVSERDNAR